MTLQEISPNLKIQLNMVLKEKGVAWFESRTCDLTMDIPDKFVVDDKTFEFTESSITYWCKNEEAGYHVVAQDDNKVLFIQLENTDMGYEIQDVRIFHIRQKH